jgi:hypothetical protein
MAEYNLPKLVGCSKTVIKEKFIALRTYIKMLKKYKTKLEE